MAARERGWRRASLVITLALTATASAIAVICITATQATERSTAQRFLATVVTSLLEIDQYVANVWPMIENAAVLDVPVSLDGFPVRLQLDPNAASDDTDSVANEIAVATAILVYDDGLDVLAGTPQVFRLISRGAAFDGTVGNLTRGGHEIAVVGLIVSGSLALLLALATAAQARGPARFGAPALAIAFGAAIVWLVALLLQSSFEGRAASVVDSFSADLWWIAADALGMLIRNAAVLGLSGAIVAGAAAVGSILLNMVESAETVER